MTLTPVNPAKPISLAYLGPQHTYSHLAALQLQPLESWLRPCQTIDEVFSTIETGAADFGIVPLYNSTCGLVSDTSDSILRRLRFSAGKSIKPGDLAMPATIEQLCISQSLGLRIDHNLVSWGDRQSIRWVASKQQALDQCRNWLQTHLPQARWLPTDSSALAITELINRPDLAAIISGPAAKVLQAPLEINAIQDEADNWTEFVLVQLDRKEKRANAFSTPAGQESQSCDRADSPIPNGSQPSEYWVVELESNEVKTPFLVLQQALKLPIRKVDCLIWEATIERADQCYGIFKICNAEPLPAAGPWALEVQIPVVASEQSISHRTHRPNRHAWRLGATLNEVNKMSLANTSSNQDSN